MKKIISIFLLLTILVTVLSACGKKPDPQTQPTPDHPDDNTPTDITLSGIDAAKLLLAEERLNEKLLKSDGDIFENGSRVMRELSRRATDNLRVKHLRSGAENGSFGDEKTGIGSFEISGDTAYWSDLGEVSNSYEYFINLTNNIVIEAETCADVIDFVKKNIRIVDKWVSHAGERYYLSVGENEELLCRESGEGDNRVLIICRRYKNDNGKDVYEMYRSSGTQYERRITYIPGEKYEISDNRNQHFIATNTKGYWENYVLGEMDNHYNVAYLIMKDDVCYRFGFLREEYTSIEVLSSDRETDIFKLSFSPNSTTVTLKLNGFDNISSISAPLDKVELYDDGGGILQYDCGGRLNLSNGNTITEYTDYLGGRVRTSSMHVMYFTYGYGAELILDIDADPSEALDLLKQFLSETGLRCRRDIDKVISGARKSIKDSVSIFNYYKWNGHSVNTEDGIKNAANVERAKYDAIIASHTAIKDAAVVVVDNFNSADAELHMSFAPISQAAVVGAKLVGDEIRIGSLTLTVSDTKLFVKEVSYRAVVALEDLSGGIVHLGQVATGEATYTGGDQFTVSATDIEIALPTIAPGSYRIVAYIATSDGIRSSGTRAVSFDSAEALPKNLGEVDLDASIEGGIITLSYTERVDVHVSIEANAVTAFAEFKKLICEAAFNYGIPDETLIEKKTENGYEALLGTEGEIGSGEYRIKYVAENGSSIRNGYVYAVFTVGEAV